VANDFSSDSNCKALWRFESGALTADSKGSNTLADNNTVGTETTNHFEGAACADLDRSQDEYFTITDANLDSGFPFKNGDTTKTGTFCFFIEAVSAGTWRYIFSKNDSGSNAFSFAILINASNQIELRNGYSNGTESESDNHASTLVSGNRYHVAITQDGTSNKAATIRIYDVTNSQLFGSDKSITWSNEMNIEDSEVQIGTVEDLSATMYDGLLDEFVVFNTILSSSDTDDIRKGEYGAAPSGSILPIMFNHYNKNIGT
jgi:hypothetical protein